MWRREHPDSTTIFTAARHELRNARQELALAGIADMAAANRHLQKVYLPAFNAEFMHAAAEDGSAFLPWIGGKLGDVLCEQFERIRFHTRFSA